METKCVFCGIIARQLPASVVYEDHEFLAFLDLFPVHPGHTLVVTKRHVIDLASCPDDVAGRLFAAATRLAPAVARATEAEGFNVWTANGKVAGQEVFHLHLHLLPRHSDDAFGLRFPRSYPREAAREDLDRMAERIRSAG
jgi:histidine triad (HIT) family protein